MHALLQYDSCELGLSDRSYHNNSILFDPTSDESDVKWLIQQGECKLASLSFRQYEYTRHVINIQEAIASGHRIVSRLKQFPPGDSRVSPIEYLLQAQLCYAAFTGDYVRMQSFLPYYRAHNCKCVHYAAAGGHVGIICKLLQEGYPVDGTNSHGQSPLHIAALFGWNEVAVELIKRGADIDKPIIEEYTYYSPLDGVVYGLPEHMDTVLALMDQGYNFSRDEVIAFLLICVRHQSTLMLNVIEQKCHDKGSCHRNVVHVATFKRSLFKVISTWDSKNSEDLVFELALLRHAAAKGRTEAAILLISESSGKDANAHVFGTPLHQAANNGHLETVKALMNGGCSVLVVPNNGRTALHCAAGRGHVDIIRELLSRNCPIDMRDKSGRTAIHHAAVGGETEAVIELIKNGADKDIVAGEYGTPLHQAAISGHLETVRALLDEGCSALAIKDNGETALHCAAGKGHVGIIRELLR